MPSPRTDAARRRLLRALAGLRFRLILLLSVVSLIALLVLGVALNQILNSYFEEQEGRRLAQAADSSAAFLTQILGVARPEMLGTRELREGSLIPRLTQLVADQTPATVEVSNPDGSVFAHAEPRNVAALRDQGLAGDPLVPAQARPFDVQLPAPEPALTGPDAVLRLTVELSEPFTSRMETLNGVRSALLAASVLALAVSFIVGVIAARRVTTPLERVQRASTRLAQGDLNERVRPSGIAEFDQLAERFNVMADRLRDSLTDTSADRDRLREFVADVSHELRTPIAALRTFTELQRDGEVDEGTRREFLDRSAEQISRLEWLSSNLLDLSRIEAGIFPLDVRPGDLRDPIRAAVEAHAAIAEERHISLSAEVPGAPVQLPFDRQRIVQLLTNLIGNALKFTPPGGVVDVRLMERPEGAILEVRDTGPGIPAEELPRIFERFYRGTNIGEARGAGSGLGLAIARSIVEMHGGTIEVESRVGAGTTFRVHLPAEQDQ
ncbi:MAG: sensor histidine kinase [Candidatus Limnocylindria bacterium]